MLAATPGPSSAVRHVHGPRSADIPAIALDWAIVFGSATLREGPGTCRVLAFDPLRPPPHSTRRDRPANPVRTVHEVPGPSLTRGEARDTDPALTIEVHPTTRSGMTTEVDVVIADVPGGPFQPPASDEPTGGLS